MGLNMFLITALNITVYLLFLADSFDIVPYGYVKMVEAVDSKYQLGENYKDSKAATIFEDGVRVYNHISMRNLLFSSNDSEHSDVKLNRTARDADTCQIPPKTAHSTLLCIRYPKYVTCKQTCTFGHTLSNGISRDYKCIHEENRWSPNAEMEECLPFLDCALRIVGSGRYTCNTTDADGKGPVCKISCNHYEDKPPVAEASYRCDNSGKWSPKLPHCVAPKGGKSLVPPPKGMKYFR